MKFAALIPLIFLLTIINSCEKSPDKEKSEVIVTDPFFGITPTNNPQLLAPDLLASPAEEYNGTFSPDGQTFYYTTDVPNGAFITFTELKADNIWSEPKIASFSGEHTDYDPLFSPDGSKLFFSSRRPLSGKTKSRVWFVEKISDGWSEPQYVTLTGSGNDEYYSSITNNGDIYFNIWSNGNLYKAIKTDTAYIVEELPEIINENYDKGDPFISPDEDYLIFRGYRNDSFGRGDLYISFKKNDNWTRPENLGKPINSSAHEMCPYVTSDGKIFIFASGRVSEKLEVNPLEPIKKVQEKYRTYDNGQVNIYYMSTNFIDSLRQNI